MTLTTELSLAGPVEVREGVVALERVLVDVARAVEADCTARVHVAFVELGRRAGRGRVRLLRRIVRHVRRVVMIGELGLLHAVLRGGCAGGVDRRGGVEALAVVGKCDRDEEAGDHYACVLAALVCVDWERMTYR